MEAPFLRFWDFTIFYATPTARLTLEWLPIQVLLPWPKLPDWCFKLGNAVAIDLLNQVG